MLPVRAALTPIDTMVSLLLPKGGLTMDAAKAKAQILQGIEDHENVQITRAALTEIVNTTIDELARDENKRGFEDGLNADFDEGFDEDEYEIEFIDEDPSDFGLTADDDDEEDEEFPNGH